MRQTRDLLTPSNSKAGFSLIEMLVVLAIITTLAGLTLPGVIRNYRTPDVQRLAEEIATRFRSARVSAISIARPVRILLDPGRGEIRFNEWHSLSLPSDISMTVTTGLETTIANRQVLLTFLPDGSASGLEIDLIGKQRARIAVNWLTGLTTHQAIR